MIIRIKGNRTDEEMFVFVPAVCCLMFPFLEIDWKSCFFWFIKINSVSEEQISKHILNVIEREQSDAHLTPASAKIMTVVDFSFQSESWLDDSFTAASFHRKSRKQNGDFRFPVQTFVVFVPFFSYFLLKPEKIQRTCRRPLVERRYIFLPFFYLDVSVML